MAETKDVDNIETVDGLRAILADEILKIRAGKTTPANVNAITNASGKILSTIKLEIEYAKVHGSIPVIGFIGGGGNQLPEGSEPEK